MTGGHMKILRKISILIIAKLVLMQSLEAHADIQNFYTVKTNGRKGTKIISYSKIPKNQAIPKLDIGEDTLIEAEQKIPLFSEDSRSLKKIIVQIYNFFLLKI
jgi:hypothetical protein